MLNVKDAESCRWDLISLGEVMLRFDPGDDRIHTARSFRVWEGGGEYNVARNLRKTFGGRAAVVTALADNQIGRLVEDLVLQGGVDASQILWRTTDGISRSERNGIYFMERGFGLRAPSGCSDRGNTPVSKLRPGDIDWRQLFDSDGSRWFHTGGIFAGLSDGTADTAAEAMSIAKECGVIVSYDMNYRESLWAERGGRDAADEVNRKLLQYTDVVFGIEKFRASLEDYSESSFRETASAMTERHSNIKVLVTTLRDVISASRHNLSGVCFADGSLHRAQDYMSVEVLDRVGSGDAFAAGFISCMLSGENYQTAIDIAAASAVLSMASLGDGSNATKAEVERLVKSRDHSALR
jgi:2-dehydro-3-deoxygluconokinase